MNECYFVEVNVDQDPGVIRERLITGSQRQQCRGQRAPGAQTLWQDVAGLHLAWTSPLVGAYSTGSQNSWRKRELDRRLKEAGRP